MKISRMLLFLHGPSPHTSCLPHIARIIHNVTTTRDNVDNIDRHYASLKKNRAHYVSSTQIYYQRLVRVYCLIVATNPFNVPGDASGATTIAATTS